MIKKLKTFSSVARIAKKRLSPHRTKTGAFIHVREEKLRKHLFEILKLADINS